MVAAKPEKCSRTGDNGGNREFPTMNVVFFPIFRSSQNSDSAAAFTRRKRLKSSLRFLCFLLFSIAWLRLRSQAMGCKPDGVRSAGIEFGGAITSVLEQ